MFFWLSIFVDRQSVYFLNCLIMKSLVFDDVLISPFSPRAKLIIGVDDMAIATIAAAGIAGLSNLIGGSNSSKASARENAKNRAFQSSENALNRQAQSDLTHEVLQYNSAGAQKARMMDAGLNPYLSEAGVGSVAGTAAPSASMAASPSQLPVGQFGEGIARAGEQLGKTVSTLASIGNQRAESMSKIVDTAIQIQRNMGSDAARQFMSSNMPRLKALGFEESVMNRLFVAQAAKEESQAKISEIQAQIESEFGRDVAQRNVWAMDQAYNESVSRVGLNGALGKVYEAQVGSYEANAEYLRERANAVASEIAKNFAEAYYAHAKGVTEDQLRSYLVTRFRQWATMEGFELDEREADYAGNTQLRVYKHSKEWQGMRKGTEMWKNSRSKQFIGEVEDALRSVPIPSRQSSRPVKTGTTREYFNGGYTESYQFGAFE